MIVPSVDIMNGNAVQLVGGREKALDAGDPLPLAQRFGIVGEVAVIDLDAALGQGSNEEIIKKLLRTARCRVGGGIRSVETAVKWLDAGAEKIILGTRAVPEVLCELPRDRLIAAVDAEHGEVVVEGWQTKTGRTLLDRIAELRDLVGGFLVTFVEREGRMLGFPMDRVPDLLQAAGSARITVAGGITTSAEVGELSRLGVDAQVGMALYTERMRLSDAVVAPLSSDRADGLWPTVVCDEQGKALGLVWSSAESVRQALAERCGVYHSRKRGIWRKGDTSGAFQELLRIDIDCDQDALRFVVRQHGGGFCHSGEWTCWGRDEGIGRLFRTLRERLAAAPPGSYTRKLFDDPELLKAKIAEEAEELNHAAEPKEVCGEAADLLYFLAVAAVKAGLRLEDLERELQFRSLKVTRRPGLAKPGSGQKKEST